jgi:hypothetical protein
MRPMYEMGPPGPHELLIIEVDADGIMSFLLVFFRGFHDDTSAKIGHLNLGLAVAKCKLKVNDDVAIDLDRACFVSSVTSPAK